MGRLLTRALRNVLVITCQLNFRHTALTGTLKHFHARKLLPADSAAKVTLSLKRQLLLHYSDTAFLPSICWQLAAFTENLTRRRKLHTVINIARRNQTRFCKCDNFNCLVLLMTYCPLARKRIWTRETSINNSFHAFHGVYVIDGTRMVLGF